MTFVSRASWGANYAKGSSRIAGPVYGVTLHWEGPRMGNFPHSECAGKVRVIERFHAVTRGWSGIAYSAIVCPHGDVFEGRGVGIRTAANGTSGIGGNDHWYAVCYMGGQGDGFTDAGKAGMVDAVQWLRKNGAGDRVNGHRDHHSTECPGDAIYAWLKTANFGTTTSKPNPKPTTEEDDMTPDQIAKAPIVLQRGKDNQPWPTTVQGAFVELENSIDARANATDAKIDALAKLLKDALNTGK